MRIKVAPPAETFPPDAEVNDNLDRIRLGQSLASLYRSLEGSSVAILHGRWGVGKSTFAKRWLNNMKGEGFGTIYFDAFANDYIGEPFDALLAEVLRQSKSSNDRKSEKIEKFKETAAAVSRALAVTSVKAGIRVATLNAIDAADLEALKDAASGVSGDVADAAKEAAKKLLERRATDVAAFEAFRKALSQIHEAAGAQEARSDGSRKTIFVIDELDRCRPDFALSLLESLKHFFQTDGLHFLLVTNKAYLSKSVDARYGLGSSSDEYLQKFYDFVVHFEQLSNNEHISASAAYSRILIRKLLSNQDPEVSSQIETIMAAYAVAFALTLRQVEHIATNISLSYLSLDKNTYAPPSLLVFLATLKSLYPSEFEKIKLGELDFQAIQKLFSNTKWENSFLLNRFMGHIQFLMDVDMDPHSQIYKEYSSSLISVFLERLQVLPFLANEVLDNFSRS